jgi:hypothetical protein
MNSSYAKVFLGAIVCSILLIAGCVNENVLNTNAKYMLPQQADSYRTDPFQQWIELKDIFKHEAPVVVINCKGNIGVVGKWATQTLCWAKIHGGVAYESVVIDTYDCYGYDSGERTSEQHYWPVDVNNDSLEDIFVLGWGYGEIGKHDKDGNYRRTAYDKPVIIRLIIREAVKGWPLDIEADTKIAWEDVKKKSDKYLPMLVEAKKQCKDNKWQKRLDAAIISLR